MNKIKQTWNSWGNKTTVGGGGAVDDIDVVDDVVEGGRTGRILASWGDLKFAGIVIRAITPLLPPLRSPNIDDL